MRKDLGALCTGKGVGVCHCACAFIFILVLCVHMQIRRATMVLRGRKQNAFMLHEESALFFSMEPRLQFRPIAH